MLEIGPGIGHHALPTARALGASGRLEALDLQPEMLEDLRSRAACLRELPACVGLGFAQFGTRLSYFARLVRE